jgi:hypothetical protein
MAESAICSGVTGTLSLAPVESPAPVSAQVMKADVLIARMGQPLSLGWGSRVTA